MVRIEESILIRAPIERCFDLARSVEVHLAGNIHCGESAMAWAGVTTGLLGLSQPVTWRAKHFGIWFTLTSEITQFDRPGFFQDAMRKGPFRLMEHDHFFRSASDGETEMRDVFRFAAPVPLLGRVAETLILRRYMRELLAERNAAIKRIAESDEWRRYLA
jgi:ligand-binding SRPBCC domain-containing protein